MQWFSRSEAAPVYAGAAHVHLFGRESVPAPLRRVTLEAVLAGDTCSPIGYALACACVLLILMCCAQARGL
jgi:hypothetical protein